MPTNGRPSKKRLFLLVGSIALFLGAALAFHKILLPFLIALLIVFVMEPLVSWTARRTIRGRHPPRWAAVLAIYLAFFGVVAIAGVFLAPKLIDEGKKLVADAPKFVERVKTEWVPKIDDLLERIFGRGLEGSLAPRAKGAAAPSPQGDAPAAREGSGKANANAHARGASGAPSATSAKKAPAGALLAVERRGDGACAVSLGQGLEIAEVGKGRYKLLLPTEAAPASGGPLDGKKVLGTRFQSFLEDMGKNLTGAVNVGITLVANVFGALAAILLVFVVAAFLSIDLERVRGFFRSLVPPTYRDDYERLLRHLARGLSGVVHGQLLICLINGTLAGVGFWALGVPYAVLWGAVAAVTNLIPFFGIIIATAPVFVLSLLISEPSGLFGLYGLWMALAVVGWALFINLLEGNLLEPKIVGKKAKIHPVLVLFAVLAGEYAFGIAGMVFAVPTLSIVQNVFLFFREKAQKGPVVEERPEPPAPSTQPP